MLKQDLNAIYHRKLLETGFNIVEHYSTNPITNVWSVGIQDSDCQLLCVNGNGVSKEIALTNAYEKFIGRLTTHHFWDDLYFGDEIKNNKFVHYSTEQWFQTNSNGSWPEGVLQAEDLHDLYNPDGDLNTSNLIDTNSSDRKRGICCLPFNNGNTGEKTNFPINILSNLYGTNGISTANDIDDARLNALLDVIKEYTKFKVIAEGVSLPNVPDALLNNYPDMEQSAKEIRATGYELLIKDASLGGKYPVVALMLLNPQSQGVKISFGAHPNFGLAYQQALLALFQNSNFDKLDLIPEPGFDMDEIASPHNLEKHYVDSNGIVAWSSLTNQPDYEFFDWNKRVNDLNSEQEFNLLSNQINEDGFDIFTSDYKELDAYTCRVVVPGFSEICPTDDLVWENNNVGIDVRHRILKSNKTNEECEQLIDDLEDLNLEDETLVSELINMQSDPECIFSDLCVAELITLLALRIQDNERIQEGCEWLIHFQKINPRRLKVYQCINVLLQLESMTEYGKALEKLYTHPILNDALALIDGEDVFPLESEWKSHKLIIEKLKKMQYSIAASS